MTTAVHVTTLSEEQVLAYFWTAVAEDVDRLALLQQLAVVAIDRPSEWDRDDVRAGMAGTTLRLTADHCFVCLNAGWLLSWHHIIQVQHGGSNDARNFVRVCGWCHQRIHPWLHAPTSTDRRNGWTWIGDMAARVERAAARAARHGWPLLPKNYISKTRQRALHMTADDNQAASVGEDA